MAFADEQKRRGDEAYRRRDWYGADSAYSQALKLNPDEELIPKLHSNRSTVRLQINNLNGAKEDARKVIELKPEWSKGYERLGSALFKENKRSEARVQFQKAVELDAFNESAQEKLRKCDEPQQNYQPPPQQNYQPPPQQDQGNYQQQPGQGIAQGFLEWWNGMSTDTRNLIFILGAIIVLYFLFGPSGSSHSRSSYGGMPFGGGASLILVMGALWILPPYFGMQPFFGMSPWTIFWLLRMFSRGQRGGQRRGRGGYGGFGGGMGGFGRRRW